MRLIRGYIVIPNLSQTQNKSISRDNYIKNVMLTNKCYVLTLEEGMIEVTLIINSQGKNDGIIDSLDFPANSNEKGSLLWILLLSSNMGAVAFAKCDDHNRFFLDEEHQMKLRKTDGNNFAEVDLRGIYGIISLIVNGINSNSGKIYVSASNQTKDAEISVKSNLLKLIIDTFDITVTDLLKFTIANFNNSDVETVLQYVLGSGLIFKDEFDNEINQTKDVLEFKHQNKINLGSGAEPMVLGNQINKLLDDYFSNIKTDMTNIYNFLTTLSAVNLVIPPTILVDINLHYQNATTQLNKILSDYSNTD